MAYVCTSERVQRLPLPKTAALGILRGHPLTTWLLPC